MFKSLNNFIKRILTCQIDSVTVAAGMVAFFSLISRFLGIFRDRILAGEFGAGDTLDVYYAAFRIPDLIFNLLVLGALSAGFIPIFTSLLKDQKRTKENKDAWDFAGEAFYILAGLLVIISLIGFFCMPYIVKLIAPGFGPEKLAKTAELSRIMFLSPVLMGISGLFGGILQSFKRFFVYSLAPVFYNVGIILGALFFVERLGISGLAWGVALGAILHMLVQLPLSLKLGFSFTFPKKFFTTYLRRLARMMVPRTMSLGITQLDLLVSTMIASTLAGGSLAVYNFANNLQSFPVGIFGISFAVAAFPLLSNSAGKPGKLAGNFSSVVRKILFFVIPSALMLFALRAQIVRSVLGTGAFSWNNTLMTMRTLSFFSIGLVAQALNPLLVRMYYARQNSRTPFYIGLFAVAIDIILCLILPNIIVPQKILTLAPSALPDIPLGVAGVAFAFSISSWVNCVLLWAVLRGQLGSLQESRIFKSVGKFIIASLAAGLVIQLSKVTIWPFIDMTRAWGILAQGFVAGMSGILTYLLACFLLGSEELIEFWCAFKRRLPWASLKSDDPGEARGL